MRNIIQKSAFLSLFITTQTIFGQLLNQNTNDYSDHSHEGTTCGLTFKENTASKHIERSPSPTEITIPEYESLPGSDFVIFLNFEGGLITDRAWTRYTDYNDFTISQSHFTEEEIVDVCKIVSADFHPWDINITTKRSLYDAAETKKRVIVYFTPDKDWFDLNVDGQASGRMSIGNASAFVWSSTTVFSGLAASHEVGHTLALGHDTRTIDGVFESYYGGHGDWVPIMGASSKIMAQWSKGEYEGANNDFDDIEIIERRLNRIEDDWNSSLEIPSNLFEIMNTSNSFSANGLISFEEDKDVFKFSTDGGNFDLDFGCEYGGAHTNLRVEAALLDINGTIVTRNETTSTSATLSANLAAGTYFLQFDGIGYLTPSTGYSDYGSLGRYQFSGTINQMNDITDLAVINVEDYDLINCNQEIEATITLENIGNTDINQFEVTISDQEGVTYSNLYSELIPAFEQKTITVSFEPNHFFDYQSTVEVNTIGDEANSNNTIQSNLIQHLYGENVRLDIANISDQFDFSWEIERHGDTIINSTQFSSTTNDDFVSTSFCLPKDSCLTLAVKEFEDLNWCNFKEYDHLKISNFPSEHTFQIGDSTVLWDWAIYGNRLFIFNQITTMNDIGVDPTPSQILNFTDEGTCPQVPITPTYTILDEQNEDTLFSVTTPTTLNVFEHEFCLERLLTSAVEYDNPESFLMYPNPASSIVYFTTNEPIKNIDLYNSQGLLIRSVQYQGSMQLDGLAKGIYFVRVSGKATKKLIIK